jgi:predicted aminopeptidase
VQACAPLSFDARRWDFPIVGSVPYLGFFDPAAARRYAAELARSEGLDVDVRPASAYSTLGWFEDPILSTMIPNGPEALGEIANTVLHESVHATLYINDQSTFNESLASFVADGLTERLLVSSLGADAPETLAWLAMQRRYRAATAQLHAAYLELDALYRSGRNETEKRTEKERILAAAAAQLRRAKPLNNAALMGYRTYDAGAPAFERLLAACNGSWRRTLAMLETLDRSSFSRRQQEDVGEVVDRLLRRGCTAGE